MYDSQTRQLSKWWSGDFKDSWMDYLDHFQSVSRPVYGTKKALATLVDDLHWEGDG